jgi:GT2 family glycosyltransferase
MTSLVDVVVVTRNHGATIGATLAGLVSQTVQAGTVFVIDNGSADDSVSRAEAFGERLPITIIRLGENSGFAAAANLGVRRGSAPFVLSLNPDCRLAPDYLAELLAALESRPVVGSATGLLLRGVGHHLDPTDIVDSAGMIVTSSGRHLDRGSGKTMAPAQTLPAWVFGASGAAGLFRRAALEDVAYPGGEVFDEGFFAYREDADLAWRLQRRGWGCLFWPRGRAWHQRGLQPEARRRGTPEVNRHSVRNRFLLRWSNADWRWRVACFPSWLLRDLVVVAACLTIERPSLAGLVEAWAMRRQQRGRGRANLARARVGGWRLSRWFVPGGRVRRMEK